VKTQHISIVVITGIVIISIVVISILFLQILTMQEHIRTLNDTNQKLVANLTNYQNLFGDISKNYTSLSLFALKTSVYVGEPISTGPVSVVKVNHPYQVIANITKNENEQPIIYYYCIVQVTNATGLDPHIGWGQVAFIPKQSFSQCAISWTPTTPGNYTISAFAWHELLGSPLGNASTKSVQVVP
jgi:hypothetical protein